MDPVQTCNTTRLFILPGGDDENNLPIEDCEDDGGGTTTGMNVMKSTWELTDQERESISQGGKILLMVWGEVHPAVALAVEPHPFPVEP